MTEDGLQPGAISMGLVNRGVKAGEVKLRSVQTAVPAIQEMAKGRGQEVSGLGDEPFADDPSPWCFWFFG